MDKLTKSELRLGIIAGGQLGKMLIQEASKWDIETWVLDAEPDCPAGGIANVHVRGSLHNFDDVYQFGKQVDVLTYEIESINIEALKRLKAEGIRVVPDPALLETIQDKGLQKEIYRDNQIPTSAFELFDDKQSILKAIDAGDLKFPFVQKIRKGGYDGRGVSLIESSADIDKLFDAPSVVEDKVEIDKEIAVIAARNAIGEVRCYPLVEMVFDPVANLVEKLLCPSTLPQEKADEATDIATRLVGILDMEGVLAVEFFLDKAGNLLLNEVAPRPHNSGHHTIESVTTSQFEQHLRAILKLPLGSTKLIMPAVMLNLLGEEGYEGPVMYEGLIESMAIEGVNVHLYGKKITRPFRKMGHVTVISATTEEAVEKAEKIMNLIKVKSI